MYTHYGSGNINIDIPKTLPHDEEPNGSFLQSNLKVFKNWKYATILTLALTTILAFPFAISYHTPAVTNLSTNNAASTIIPLQESQQTLPTLGKPTAKPTSKPSFGSTDDDDTYIGFYDQYDLRFTTYRYGYPTVSYFLPNASEIYAYKILRPYTGVVEPYANMRLLITATGDDLTEKQYYHKYTICNDATEECITGFDYVDDFSFGCDALNDTFSVSIEQYDTFNDQLTGRTSEGALLCMYVRREFRDLTDEDMGKTMDAMYTMWTTSEDEGKAIYGDDYHNYDYLLEFHYFNAAWMDADHVHEGIGFQAQHIKMSNIFEKSMQTVDPSISLPYWDYTIETAEGTKVWDSPMFQENTFGSLTIPNNSTWGWLYKENSIDDGKILDGRWANWEAEYNTKYDDLYFGYGYMRAPWNVNPSKYITRYVSIDKDLPGCDSHYTMLEYDTITDFLHQIPYAPHASTHGVVGGVFGCDAFDSLREAGYITDVEGQLNLCKNWIFYLKEIYRSDVLIPPMDCNAADSTGEYSVDREDISCAYTCNEDRMNVLYLMLTHSILNSDYECVNVDTMTDEGWNAWIDFICGGDGSLIFGGDHLESASPADPSFWPIHPTSERLMQAKYMAGGFASDAWPTDALGEYVCNKVSCYDSDVGDFVLSDDCCYGHFQFDQMFDAPNNDRDTKVGPTNDDIHRWTNPTKDSYAMPYIYDTFTWDHCTDSGYDFDSLITSLYWNGDNYYIEENDSEKGW